jgi:glutaminase
MPTTLAEHFPIQSICTRLFGLMLAMSRCDDQAWILVGKEPPDTVFNSLAVE